MLRRLHQQPLNSLASSASQRPPKERLKGGLSSDGGAHLKTDTASVDGYGEVEEPAAVLFGSYEPDQFGGRNISAELASDAAVYTLTMLDV
jgi:hypothetical protein